MASKQSPTITLDFLLPAYEG